MNLKKAHRNQLTKKITEIKQAIKENCFDCMNEQKKIDCQLERCPLYNFRPWAAKED